MGWAELAKSSYRLFILSVSMSCTTLSACSSDISFEGYIPPAVKFEPDAIITNRQSGECAAQVFHLSPEYAELINRLGLDALSATAAMRSSAPLGKSGAFVQYMPWQNIAVHDQSLPEHVRSKASWGQECLAEDDEIQAAFREALSRPGSYFTYSVDPGGYLRSDVLVIIPKQSVIVVLPY